MCALRSVRPLLTAASLQGPSSSPTSLPWSWRGSHSSTLSWPSGSVCAEAVSGSGWPSRPTWAESVCSLLPPAHQCSGGQGGGCGFARHVGTMPAAWSLQSRRCPDVRGRETRDQAAASPSRSVEASFGPLTNGLGGGCCGVSSGCKRRTQSWAVSSVTAAVHIRPARPRSWWAWGRGGQRVTRGGIAPQAVWPEAGQLWAVGMARGQASGRCSGRW